MGDEDEALTLADAARATGVDRRVLRQRIEGGGFPGAFRQQTSRGPGTGSWLIPIADLVASGMSIDDSAVVRRVPSTNGDGPNGDGPNGDGPNGDGPNGGAPNGGAAGEVERLRAELAEERERRVVAEAIAEERGQALDDARLALRAIAEAGTASAPDTAEVAYEDEPRPRPRGNWLR